MAAAGDVCAGLIRHKLTLLRELCDTHILDVLVKKGLFSLSDHELITGASDTDKCNYFVEVVSKQSGAKLNELCSVLERECPKLSKELMNDRQRFIVNGYSAGDSAKENMVMSHNLNRESPRSRRSVSQCSCNSRRSSMAASPAPAQLPPLNNTMEMYVEPVVEDAASVGAMMYGQGRNRSMYGTVRSLVPSRTTPVAGLEDVLYTPPYFYHIPPPPPLNTYPGRKRRKRDRVSSQTYRSIYSSGKDQKDEGENGCK